MRPISDRILQVLIEARQGVNIAKIVKTINEKEHGVFVDDNSIRVTMAKMNKDGWIRTGDEHECSCCGVSKRLYHVTDQGRIVYNN